MNELTIDYFRYYTALITADEILLLKKIFDKYENVPFELTITAEEFILDDKDNYKRLFVAVNNLYGKYVNFSNKDYGFQIRWLQKVEIDLEGKLVRLQWSDDIFRHLNLLRDMLNGLRN